MHQPKKRTQNSWLETDLDSGITLDHGLDSPSSPALSSSPRGKQNGGPYPHFSSPTQIKDSSPTSRQQQANLQSYPQSPQNHISSLSPQLREQIHQHQLKQQLLKDQMQGKGSLIQANVAPLYINTDSRIQGEKKWYNFWGKKRIISLFQSKNSRRMSEFLKQNFYWALKQRNGIQWEKFWRWILDLKNIWIMSFH